MLLYSVYLNNVRQMHYEGIQILRSFQSIMFAQNANNELEAASAAGNVAVVIVSLDKAKAGTILNASGSIHNIFNFRKTELIGKKHACLFPSSIAKVYQQSFQQYAKAPEYKLDIKERTYGKTSNSEIFELEAHLQLYPYVNKELTLMILLRKLDEPAPILIANSEGVIVDWSKTLESMFQKESLNIKNFNFLKNLNPGLEEANLAFNIVHGQNPQQVQSTAKDDTKPWFNSEHTAIDYEESSRDTGRSLLRDRTKTFAPAGGMHFSKAERICEEYQEGKQIVLCPEKKSQVRAHVSIKLLRAEEEIFKIVRINNLKKERSSYFESSDEDDNGILTFGDEFPADQEKVLVKKISTVKIPKTKGAIGSTFTVKEKESLKTESQPDSEKDQDHMNKAQQKLNDLQRLWDQDDQRSSVMNSHHLESRAVRTLRDIGSRQKLQRSLCSLQITLYIVITVVLILSFVKFELSKSSIEEIEKGVSVINLATLRLQNVINTFLWSLVYVTGVHPSQALGFLATSMSGFTESSIQLEHELGLITNKEFLKRAFQKDVKFWQLPVLGDTKNEMTIDTFAATNILMGKYLAIQEAQSLLKISMMPDLILIFNNTANDYIISSNDFISATDNILGEIISKDILILRVVLAIEIIALVGYTFIFVSMIYIISHSYQKLCRALMRTQDVSILQRISQLKKVKTLLEDDIERKAFIQDGFDLFIEERSLSKANDVKAQMATHQSHLKMSLMNAYLIRIAIICLLFIPVFTGLFVGTLVKSINAFNSLGSVNEELAVLSFGSLQSNLMMSTIIYASMNAAYPNMLVMNKPPAVQTAENFANFNGLNQKLIETFLSSKEREIDPYLVEILQSNVCKHLSDEYKKVCQYATNSQNMGLLSVNTDYYNMLGNIIAAVGLSISLADALVIYAGVLNKIIGEMSVMMEIYPIMMSHVIEGFEETVRTSKKDEERYIILIFVIVGVYVVFIYLKPLKDFQKVDVGRRKILKIIPADIIQGNKALKFYLMQDFKTEVEEIKNQL